MINVKKKKKKEERWGGETLNGLFSDDLCAPRGGEKGGDR